MTLASKLLAALVTLLTFAQAACLGPLRLDDACGSARSGLSTFGRPPELAALWMAAGVGAVWLILRAASRRDLARRLTTLLVAATLLDGHAFPVVSELRLLLAATTLGIAAPELRGSRSARVTLLALVLAIPAIAGGLFPHGTVVWLTRLLPAASLAWLVPSLFDRDDARRLVLVIVLLTGALCFGALASYLTLAEGLDLPLGTVLRTRLFVAGLHPNLAVPHLVGMLVLGTGLAWSSRGSVRQLTLAASLCTLAALWAVQSRTGFATVAAGLGLLVCMRLARPLPRLARPLSRLARPAAVLAVTLLLIVPASGVTDGSIHWLSPEKASKAVSFRSAMWQLGRDTFSAAPWHGFGPGARYVQARFATPSRYDGLSKGDHPHNVVLAVGEELGWPGLLALALLFAASMRRPRGDGMLAAACGCALITTWGANAIDMGGAATTLYPSLVFLLLGLRDADDGLVASDPHSRPVRLSVSLLAWPVGLIALALLIGRHDKNVLTDELTALAASVDDAPRGPGSGPPEELGDPRGNAALIRRAARVRNLRPLDPHGTQLRAEVAHLLENAAWPDIARLLQRAQEQMPGSAHFAHQHAIALTRLDPGRPRVGELLTDAVRFDAYGREAWSRHLDLARWRTLRDQREDAFESLVTSLILNPGAAADLHRSGAGDTLQLHPAGPDAAGFPVVNVLAEIARRRAALGADDRPSEQRLRLREVEVLHALDEYEHAARRTSELFGESPLYLVTRTASAALAQEHYEQALQALIQLGDHGTFHLLVDELTARAHAEPLDVGSFEAVLDRAFAALDDVTFESDTVVRLLAARRKLAERRGDALTATRMSEAMAFARR